jgi:RimJ/RimL family protein N-acetyltransferase
MPVTSATTDIRILLRADVAELERLRRRIEAIPEFWNDTVANDKEGTFAAIWCDPNTLLFDVCDDGGVVAFLNVTPHWRAACYVAAWSKRAHGRDDLFKIALATTMLRHELLVVDAFVKPDNRLSRRSCERVGFLNRGTIRDAVCYNGHPSDLIWYEIHRDDVLR